MRPLDHIDLCEHDCCIGDNAPPRLQNELWGYAQGTAAALEYGQHRPRQVGWGGSGAVRMVLDSKAPAKVDPLNLAACCHNRLGYVHHLACRLCEWGGIQDLGADVAVQANG